MLKELGVRAVIAGSFARIFFRNAINIGLPAIICKEAYDKVKQDDVVELDMSEGLLKIGDETLTCTRLPEYMQTILNAGGLIEFLNKEEVE